MATDYENGPTRTPETDANVHSRPNFGMSQHMPDVHAGATRQALENTDALNRGRAEQGEAQRDTVAQEAAAGAAGVRPEFKTAGQEATEARPDFSQGSAGVVLDPTDRPELKHAPQTEITQQAHEQVIARNGLGY